MIALNLNFLVALIIGAVLAGGGFWIGKRFKKSKTYNFNQLKQMTKDMDTSLKILRINVDKLDKMFEELEG